MTLKITIGTQLAMAEKLLLITPKQLCDGGFYSQSCFKTAIAKHVLYAVLFFQRWQKIKLTIKIIRK